MSGSTPKLAGKARRILLASIGEARLATKLCPCALDQDTRSKDRVRGQIRSFRAVAQLGRAPGSGQSPDDFLKLSQLTLTCSTLGKSAVSRSLTRSQKFPKFSTSGQKSG